MNVILINEQHGTFAVRISQEAYSNLSDMEKITAQTQSGISPLESIFKATYILAIKIQRLNASFDL